MKYLDSSTATTYWKVRLVRGGIYCISAAAPAQNNGRPTGEQRPAQPRLLPLELWLYRLSDRTSVPLVTGLPGDPFAAGFGFHGAQPSLFSIVARPGAAYRTRSRPGQEGGVRVAREAVATWAGNVEASELPTR